MLPDIITKARGRLLVRAPFFGSIALGLEWVDKPAIRTMATDGRAIWFHAAWCEALGVEKTMGVVAHEVLHVVNKHHLRRRDRDLRLWNVACDLVVNRILLVDNYLLPDTLLFDGDGRFAGLPAEVIYERLLEERQRPDKQKNEEPVCSAPDQGSAQAQDIGHGSPDQDGQKEGQGRKPAENWGEVRDLTAEDGGKLTDSARRRAEDDLDMRIRQAAAAAKRAGRFGGALHEVVEAALERVDWRDRLRTLFDGTMRSEASWTRPNRRFLPHGLYLPGWRRAGAGRVAFVLDTSGSISARELSIYAANLLGIIEETGPEQVALIQCDTEVKQVAYLGPGESAGRIEVAGRGGTLFQPAFDWIAESGFAPNVVVYATDLGSADRPADPECPVIWLTPTRGKTMPFGEIVEVMP
jgi:predicted metal-dependent peptidase